MNIKKQASRFLSVLLSLAMTFGSVLPANATEAIITESALEGTDAETIDDGEDLSILNDGIEAQADIESRYETVEVNYNQSSSYYVTIPKTIALGTDKRSPYSIKVEGDIVANKQVCVVPVDGITDTEVFDFYMKDQIAGSTKDDVVAEVSHAKFYWNHNEVAAGYEENGNYVIADGLSAGTWRGIFQLEISMRTDPTHIHNYVGEVTKEPTCTEEGEKTYTCDCGDSYTEKIPVKGHHYEKGKCTICGEEDPNHKHNYTETITKEPTCTEKGEKTYTCECGDSYTGEIPATGHNYIDGTCTECGDKDPDYHKHNYTEKVTKEPTCTEEGEKTYTCECGDSYTEKIPAKGHKIENGTCTECGDKDPNHEHKYTEKVTKEPTCTEKGEKTYTCICGESYTEEIPATGHRFVEGECEHCGEKDPDYHKHSYTETITKEPTCTEEGEKTYICECGASYTEIIKTTEHDYIDHDLKWEATNVSRTTQSGNVWTFNKGSYSNASATFNVTVNETIEYTFNYYTKVNSSSDYLLIKLDNTQILKKTSSVTNGTYTITLTPGIHTLYTYWYSTGSETAVKATLTLKPIEHLNHKCTICGNEEDHDYRETISKAATCEEKGEKKFTCIDCGYSYTEEYESLGGHIDEDDDDICDICGHKHIWEENTDIISWTKNSVKSSSASSVVQTGNTWKLNYVNVSSQYTTYTLNGYWDMTVPEDIEYTFNYTSGFVYAADNVKIYVDDNIIVNFNGNQSGSEKIPLSKGNHTIHMSFSKNNEYSTASYASITLNPITDYHHVCTECGDKNRHSYTEEILKAPTCTEKGEKELTCTKCGHSHTEEIEPTGHSFVDHTVGLVTNHKCNVCGYEEDHKYGADFICTVCGHFRGEYTFVFNSESKIGSIANNTKYEYDKTYITDGGTIYLPDASSSDYDLNGWYYAKNVEQPYMYNEGLSHVTYGTYDKSYNCWFNSDLYLKSCGDNLNVTNIDSGKNWYTNYQWKNTATTDVFTIETPAIYEFQITEEQHIDTIALNGGYSLQYLLKDITNAKSYDMHNLASGVTKLYDYGNIKIKCHKVDNADKNDTTKYIDGTITYYYTVFFEPGEYQITLSGRLGSSTASLTTSTIDVNMYGQNSHFYELYPLEEGETFDPSEIYTVEGDRTIYCVPKWKSKE